MIPLPSEAPYLIATTASPKAAMFAAGSGRTVEIWNTTSRGRLALWQDLPSPLLSLAFSSDGKRFALGLDNGEIEISDAGTKLNSQTRRLARKTSRRGPVLTALAFSPDLSAAAGGDIDGNIWLWETGTGRELLRPESLSQSVQRLTFSPNGRLLVAGDLGGTLKIMNIATGTNRIVKGAHATVISSITFSPDGDMLATAGAEVKLWDVSRLWQPAAAPLATFDGRRGPVQDLAFSSDARTLATAGPDHVKLWNVHTRQEMMTFPQPGGTITVAFPSQHILAVAGVDGVKLWSAAQDDE
jgi:WD40 repeat protein